MERKTIAKPKFLELTKTKRYEAKIGEERFMAEVRQRQFHNQMEVEAANTIQQSHNDIICRKIGGD